MLFLLLDEDFFMNVLEGPLYKRLMLVTINYCGELSLIKESHSVFAVKVS